MRHIGLFAFGLTTAVLVPAALRQLDAGPKQIARLAAPSQQTLELDGAKIEVSTDRAIVDAGDKVVIRLHGAIAKGKPVTVELLVMESRGADGGRVDDPPRTLERTSVTLTSASPDQEVAFRLPGFRGTSVAGRDPLGHYTFFVMRPDAADRFERLHRRSYHEGGMLGGAFPEVYAHVGERPEPPPTQDADREDDVAERVAKVVGKPMETARLDIQTRATDSTIAIAAPATGAVGEQLAVTVSVTNPTKQKLSANVHLGTPSSRIEHSTSLTDEQIAVEAESITVALAPREKKDVTFHVRAKAAGILGLHASVECADGENQKLCERVVDGQIDAIEIVERARVTASK